MAQRAGRLSGRVALVTGGGMGIGLATARVLAGEGAAVAVGDLAGYEEAARAIEAESGRAIGVRLDVTDPRSVEAAVDRVVDELGGLHVLVNNAGIGWPKPLADLEDEDWDRMMAVNLKGPFLCSRAALPHLRGNGQAGGAIVNLSSLAGRSSSPVQACAYSASKAGLLGLTRHLARELGPSGIRVNAVCPGPVHTDLLERTMSAETMQRIADQAPLRRLGTPEDIARAILFLASDDAAYVTGASLDANGGVFMA